MYIFFLPLIFLPLIEIFAFVKIIHAIGFAQAFMWVIGATLLGFSLLRARGGDKAWGRIQKGTDDGFVVSDLFDGICVRIAAVLLIFPGFISDFIAIPFLISPFRHWIFDKIKNNPDSVVRRYAKPGTFEDKPAHNSTGHNTIIDGEFRKIDNNDQ